MATANTVSVTINVTVAKGHATAPDASASLGQEVVWNVEGDLGPHDDDEVKIRGFRRLDGDGPSPMKKTDGERVRKGKGPIEDSVKSDAETGRYEYGITVVRGGVAAALDPIIQIKP